MKVKFTQAQGVRSMIAVLGLGLLGVDGWQIVEHSGPRTVVSSQESVVSGDLPVSSAAASTAAVTSPAERSATAASPRTTSSSTTTPPASAAKSSTAKASTAKASTPTSVTSSARAAKPVRPTRVPSNTAPGTTVPSGQVVPTRLSIPVIGMDASVAPAPTRVACNPWLNRTVSEFGIPDDTTSVAWWSDGPPVGGGPGLAVLLGHTTIGGSGVFNNLGKLRPGDAVEVSSPASSKGLIVRGVVTDVPKTDATALQHTLQNAPSGALVALVTCSGDINPSGTSHADNTVVFLAAAG